MPGQTGCTDRTPTCRPSLQWRAGQLPGQTVAEAAALGDEVRASMEGRTIARPDRSVRGAVRAQHHRFNGGPDNCPARPALCSVDVAVIPASMEGRTIARPDVDDTDRWRPLLGPASMEGRTIARPDRLKLRERCSSPTWLQWRAGQLPGQTCQSPVNSPRKTSLQWRAGQLPGQTALALACPPCNMALQWRGGQLPGQTGRPAQ